MSRCAGKEVKVLIDSGSNNNFINEKVAERLKLKTTSIKGFKVATGSGTYLYCDRKCERANLKIQGLEFNVDLFLLEIKGSNVVLGVQWLIELGTIKTNYRDLTMQFCYQGREVVIQGENMLTPIPLKGKTLNKLMMTDSIIGFYQMQTMVDQNDTAIIPTTIKYLVDQFQEVFEEPKSLPPPREIDQRIPIEPNAKPISIRPYRYPQFQKIEIERLVHEMQAVGVIRDSRSLYSSPVLLVKKKDGLRGSV